MHGRMVIQFTGLRRITCRFKADHHCKRDDFVATTMFHGRVPPVSSLGRWPHCSSIPEKAAQSLGAWQPSRYEINITERAAFCQEFQICPTIPFFRLWQRVPSVNYVKKITFFRCVRLPNSGSHPINLIDNKGQQGTKPRCLSASGRCGRIWPVSVCLHNWLFVKALREERGDSRRLSPGNRGLFFLSLEIKSESGRQGLQGSRIKASCGGPRS